MTHQCPERVDRLPEEIPNQAQKEGSILQKEYHLGVEWSVVEFPCQGMEDIEGRCKASPVK